MEQKNIFDGVEHETRLRCNSCSTYSQISRMNFTLSTFGVDSPHQYCDQDECIQKYKELISRDWIQPLSQLEAMNEYKKSPFTPDKTVVGNNG